MAETEIYWEGIDTNAESEAKSLLKAQALNLGRITKNIVEATITTTLNVDDADGFIDPPTTTHCFVIIAPLLGYQRFILFCVDQIIGVEYPLTVYSSYWEKAENCNCENVEDLKKCLKEILSSEKTKGLVNSIIGQSK